MAEKDWDDASMTTSDTLTAAQWVSHVEHQKSHNGYSYLVFLDGSTIKAKNGETGDIDYSSTDASTVIQAVVDQLDAGDGGSIHFASGTYLITTDIIIDTNITLDGDGWTTILKISGADAIFKTPTDSGGNIIIRDMKFDANDTATYCLLIGQGSSPPYVTRVLVENCYFYTPSTSQYGIIQFAGSNITFSNNFVENCYIINFFDGDYWVFCGNHVKNTYDSCVSLGSGYEHEWQHAVVANNLLQIDSSTNSGFCVDVFGGINDVIVANNVCWGGKYDCISVGSSGGGPAYPGPRVSVVDNICYNAGRHGIRIDSSTESYFIVDGNHVYDPAQYGITVAANNVIISNNEVVNSNNRGIHVYGDGSTSYSNISISGNQISYGNIYISNLKDSVISNNHICDTQYSGMDIRGIKNSVISGNVIKNSGQTGDSNYDDGISIHDGSYSVTASINNIITNNRIFDDQATKTQEVGIKTFENSDYNLIKNNNVDGNNGAGIEVAGSNTFVGFNIGYITENSGTGSITSGGTTDVITHGLSVTPTAEDISITLKENPTNTPGAIWVDTITSTQFTVNCENDPGASNLDFGWRAIVL
ncbi:MAG: right-handed parallel beta-helix repeat-containing protein [Halobacteriota archaeon]|nr:right-handed parallel beta-helix repeat-containing protein [Halobacteriota archaeon]